MGSPPVPALRAGERGEGGLLAQLQSIRLGLERRKELLEAEQLPDAPDWT